MASQAMSIKNQDHEVEEPLTPMAYGYRLVFEALKNSQNTPKFTTPMFLVATFRQLHFDE